MECSIEGCANQMKYGKTGWCQTHYHRWWRSGTTDLLVRRPNHEALKYRAVHAVVEREWGRARKYLCVACGDRAKEWAYDGTDPSEKEELIAGRHPVQFSVWPEFYMPMCFPCHRLKDASARWARRSHFPKCGHPRTEENIQRRKDGRPNGCRTCKLANDRDRYLKRKKAA